MKNSYLSEMILIDVTDVVKIIGRALYNPLSYDREGEEVMFWIPRITGRFRFSK